MTCYPLGINQICWQIAKSSDEISFANIANKFSEYSGVDPIHISEREIICIFSDAVGEAMQHGLIKEYMFREFMMDKICPNNFAKDLWKDYSYEFRILCGLIGLLRFVQVKTSDGEILVNYGQFEYM